jgi:hypothetical protein
MPDFPDPVQRLARMLWFCHASDRFYDPIHGLIRREALMRSGLIRLMTYNDMMLAAELALMGPLAHVRECLFHRRRAYASHGDRAAFLRRLHPTRWRELEAGPMRIGRVLLSIVGAADLTPSQQARCLLPVGIFTAKQASRHCRRRIRLFRRRIGLTRQNLDLLRDRGSPS